MNTDIGFVPAASDTHMNVYTFALLGKIPDDTNLTSAHPLVLLLSCCMCTSAALRSVQMYSSQPCLKYAMDCRAPGTDIFVVLSVLKTDNCIS